MGLGLVSWECWVFLFGEGGFVLCYCYVLFLVGVLGVICWWSVGWYLLEILWFFYFRVR